MDNFDKLYKEEILKEDWKSLATAGAILGGALASNPANADVHRKAPTAMTQRAYSDEEILRDAAKYVSKHEGFKPKVYDDNLDIPSIGYGFNLRERWIQNELRKRGYNIRRLLAGREALRKKDAQEMFPLILKNVALKDAKKYATNWDELPYGVKLVLVDMAYQLGYNKLMGFKETRKGMLRGDLKTMAKEMKKSHWYHQTPKRAKENINVVRANAHEMKKRY